MKRVLIIGEAVTLAHVARANALAGALPPDRYAVTLATDARVHHLVSHGPGALRHHASADPEAFMRALATGRPVHDPAVLAAQVNDDLALMRELAPDVVVGDFRLSLSISAEQMRIPYVNVSNAHWSPHARVRWTVPDVPLARFMSEPWLSLAMGLARPFVFASHARPVNTVRAAFGMASLGDDLRRIYTAGDYCAHPDVPELVPTIGAPVAHRYIGPILWSPAVPNPAWWDELPTDRPIVYASLGSSGPARLLPELIAALESLPVTSLIATAGRAGVHRRGPNVFVAPFLPGAAATSRAAVTVSNGGMMSVHQSLACGRPIVGIASNLDQHLSMAPVVERGAGLVVRSERATAQLIAGAVRRVLDDPAYAASSRQAATLLGTQKLTERFTAMIDAA